LPSRRFIVSILLLALALRLLPATVNFVVGTDEALYLTLGQNLAAGRGFTEDGATPHTEFAPGYPFLAALIYKFGGGLELPAQINLLVFGALLVLPVYGLTRELADAPTARRAALLTALLPALALSVPNFEAPTEQMYNALLWSGWLFLWRTLTRADWKNAVAAGLCLGLAHLTRIEGILFIPLGALLLALAPFASRPTPPASRFILHPSAFILASALLALPYAFYIHAHTGLWLAPKGLLHQYHGEALRSGDPLAFEAAYSEYEANRQRLAELPSPLEYLWQNRADLPGFYARNLVTELRQALTSASFMLILWLPFALWGAIKLWKTERGPAKVLFLALTALPALIHPFSVVDPRYLLPLLPGAMMLTAFSLKSEARSPQPPRHPPTRLGIWILEFEIWNLGFGLLLALFLAADLLGPFLIPRPVEYKALGLWMREHGISGTEAGVLARKRQPAFYAGARWEWLPLADTEGMLAYAAGHRAQYAVIDERTALSLRPDLVYLLDPRAAPESLELAAAMMEQGKRIVLYRLRQRPETQVTGDWSLAAGHSPVASRRSSVSSGGDKRLAPHLCAQHAHQHARVIAFAGLMFGSETPHGLRVEVAGPLERRVREGGLHPFGEAWPPQPVRIRGCESPLAA
jgi:4-amino-4-deoxy-L-arabinose transferase-like glycosyltransferase